MSEGRDRRPVVLAVFALIAVGVSGGCGGDGSTEQARAGLCKPAPPQKSRAIDLAPPPQTVKRGEKLTAVIATNCGTFDIDLDARRAPKTVNSFVYLARQGFYDGLSFERIAADPPIIQGGDPLGDRTGGPGYYVDEPPPPNLAYTKGIAAMAKTTAEPPGRSGSQFFIVTGAVAALDPDFALLGKVPRGPSQTVLERISKLGTPTQIPKQTVLMYKVTIEKG